MHVRHFLHLTVLCALISAIALVATGQAQTIRSAVGADAASIQSAVDAFRADLGVLNANGPCAVTCVPGVGRREINWDAVPDAFSSGGANPFPGNFFNLASGNPAGRVRGALFTTAGGFEVSADSDSDGDGNPGPVATLFGNHSPDNAADFEAFSAERIFGLVGGNVLDVTFDVPGSPGVAARVRGFGAVFTDVELAGASKIEYFDGANNLLTSQNVLPFVFTGADSFKSFSFLGVSFANPDVARVRITNGGYDVALQVFGADDAVAMDDFIYGEPILVPEPMALGGFALACLGILRRVMSRN